MTGSTTDGCDSIPDSLFLHIHVYIINFAGACKLRKGEEEPGNEAMHLHGFNAGMKYPDMHRWRAKSLLPGFCRNSSSVFLLITRL